MLQLDGIGCKERNTQNGQGEGVRLLQSTVGTVQTLACFSNNHCSLSSKHLRGTSQLLIFKNLQVSRENRHKNKSIPVQQKTDEVWSQLKGGSDQLCGSFLEVFWASSYLVDCNIVSFDSGRVKLPSRQEKIAWHSKSHLFLHKRNQMCILGSLFF